MPFVSEEELEEELSVFGVEFNNPQIIEKCNSTYKILMSKCQMRKTPSPFLLISAEICICNVTS
jgi:hypothetical protein